MTQSLGNGFANHDGALHALAPSVFLITGMFRAGSRNFQKSLSLINEWITGQIHQRPFHAWRPLHPSQAGHNFTLRLIHEVKIPVKKATQGFQIERLAVVNVSEFLTHHDQVQERPLRVRMLGGEAKKYGMAKIFPSGFFIPKKVLGKIATPQSESFMGQLPSSPTVKENHVIHDAQPVVKGCCFEHVAEVLEARRLSTPYDGRHEAAGRVAKSLTVS